MAPEKGRTEHVVEIAFATPEKQVLLEIDATPGLTVGEAIERSGVAARFPSVDLDSLETGIWGRLVPREHPVKAGDRVEIYRPLAMDPREARRRRAAGRQ